MKTATGRNKLIAITTGDLKGVGLEVATKALLRLNFSLRRHRAIFFLFRGINSTSSDKKFLRRLDQKFSRFTFSDIKSALFFLDGLNPAVAIPDDLIIDIASDLSPAEWVVQATHLCLEKRLDSIVTGPLSKSTTSLLRRKPLGHTGIFRNILPNASLNMAFYGREFSVLLATDHIPFQKVEQNLLAGDFDRALKNAVKFKSLLKSEKKIGILGLNPHSGEGGLIGSTEKRLFRRRLNPSVFEGPLVPDAAFLRDVRSKYCVLVSLYHDQGLIPFKAIHGQDSGVHITMGLPFIRTSVDHGTAENIYGKDVANPSSMLDAIKLNLELLGVKNV